MRLTRKTLLGSLLLVFLLVPAISVVGQEPEVQWDVSLYKIPDLISVGQTFSIYLYIDAEGNDLARELYNETIFRIWCNITLSDGLKWSWQSSSQSVLFWMDFAVTKVGGVTSPHLAIHGTDLGWRTISIEIWSEPLVGNTISQTVGLWITPTTTTSRTVSPTFSEYTLPVGIIFCTGFVAGLITKWAWDRKEKK